MNQNRYKYNFPSAPSTQRQPYAPQGAGPSPYDQPPAPRIQPVQPQGHSPEPAPADGSSNPLVRPYAMMGGRTRPRYQLAIEALVYTTAQPHQMQALLPEHQRICSLCRETKSVAEISALLTIPLGVARILVADLAEAELVAIHQPGGDEDAGGQPDVTLLERVLSGLRRLPGDERRNAVSDISQSLPERAPETPGTADRTADQKIAERYSRLLDGLEYVLDVEDDLVSVILKSDYEAAGGRLDEIIDTEDGLRMVLGFQTGDVHDPGRESSD